MCTLRNFWHFLAQMMANLIMVWGQLMQLCKSTHLSVFVVKRLPWEHMRWLYHLFLEKYLIFYLFWVVSIPYMHFMNSPNTSIHWFYTFSNTLPESVLKWNILCHFNLTQQLSREAYKLMNILTEPGSNVGCQYLSIWTQRKQPDSSFFVSLL